MIRAEVELRHDGQAAHKHEAAVDVQQQASYKEKGEIIISKTR